jgi:ferrous iron transport protein B
VGRADFHVEPELVAMAAHVGTRADALLVLEGDPVVSERHGVPPGDLLDEIYANRRARVDDIVGHVLTETTEGASFAAKLSHAMMHPLTGIPMLLGLLYVMYVVLGVWIAGGLVGVLEEGLMLAYWVPFIENAVGSVVPASSALYVLLAGEFGVLTMAPTYLIGVILPLVAGFYLLLAVLEDSGYLPRIAALADRSLTAIGLNGRAVIPLILGLGCVTMGTLTTRILGSRRERFIATALMAIAVPCSGQLAVIVALMAGVGLPYAALYGAVLLVIFVVIGTVLSRVTPGTTTDLLIDLPSLRIPRVDNIARKTVTKVWHFMAEVTVFFVAGAALVSVLDLTGALQWITQAAVPLTAGWLGLPPEAATAFVMGFVRRDFGAAGFFTMSLTAQQLVVAMVTITLFVPCIASIMVILKERGWAYLAGLLAGSLGVAFLVGGVLARLLGVV